MKKKKDKNENEAEIYETAYGYDSTGNSFKYDGGLIIPASEIDEYKKFKLGETPIESTVQLEVITEPEPVSEFVPLDARRREPPKLRVDTDIEESSDGKLSYVKGNYRYFIPEKFTGQFRREVAKLEKPGENNGSKICAR